MVLRPLEPGQWTWWHEGDSAGSITKLRLAISLVALAGALLLTLLASPTDELPSNQTVDVPALQAKS